MSEANVWFGLTTFLGGSILTGIAAYFGLMRNTLTKESHSAICADKQRIVAVELKLIHRTLEEHGEMLKRILFINGKGGK